MKSSADPDISVNKTIKIRRHIPWLMQLAVCSVLICALAIAAAPSAVHAAEHEKKTVRVGWFTSDLFQEGTGDEPKSGYGYDYLRKIADYTTWEYEYVYGDWSTLYDQLCRGEIDVMAGMSATPEREDLMLFPNEAMETDIYYLYKHSEDTEINAGDLTSFAGRKIGLLKDNRISDFAEEWVESKNISAQIVYFDDFDTLHAAFESGQIDLEPRTSSGASDLPDIAAAVRLGEEPSYLAVSKQRADLLSDLNEAISSMNAVEPYALQEMHYSTYGNVYASKALTVGERQWLEAHPVVKVGYIDDYLPYCGTNADGQADGLITDVISAIITSLGIDPAPDVQYIAYDYYDDVVAALESGEIDIAFPVSDDAWKLEQRDVSASADVISDRGVLFYKTAYDKEDIRTLAVMKDRVFHYEYSFLAYPDAEIIFYTTIDECLDAVVRGDADGTIMDSLRVQYVTNRSQYDSLKYVQLSNITGKCFGISHGDPALLMLINRGLQVLGSSYGYDRSFQYVDQLYTYGLLDFIRAHLALTGTVLACFFAVVVLLFTSYIRRQREEIAEKDALRREAEAANAAKSTFLFNMSHDIRTPMNAVLGFNELMLQNINDPDKLREYIEKSRLSGEYLLGLINNVLEVSRIDSGREVLNEEFADLMDENYYVVFENEVRRKNLHVTRSVDVQHRYVYTDAHKIREILLNIISNAVKYTNDGGSIDISLKELPCSRKGYASYVCAVSDTGIGMTKEFQEHIFETFAREHNSTDSKVMGTGLGMAIVKKLVDIMGGTITVESEPGKGSTFTISMDLRLVENPEEYLKEEQEQLQASDETFSLEGRRLLMAEDNELNAEIATAILENLGAAIEVAKDGIECMDMLKSHEAGYYSLILMDIQMPNLNGYETTKKIRALSDAALAGIPIVAMTANAFDEDKRAAFDVGMNGHIAKPIDVNKLIKVLQSLKL
jgi:signal transduction histidine kinase/ActR/RegA family two-component response regulator